MISILFLQRTLIFSVPLDNCNWLLHSKDGPSLRKFGDTVQAVLKLKVRKLENSKLLFSLWEKISNKNPAQYDVCCASVVRPRRATTDQKSLPRSQRLCTEWRKMPRAIWNSDQPRETIVGSSASSSTWPLAETSVVGFDVSEDLLYREGSRFQFWNRS